MPSEFQTNLYQFLNDHFAANELSPSYTDMVMAMGISLRSKSLITRSLRALSKEGKIILKKDGRRVAIALSSSKLPLIGRISAGLPIEAISDIRYIDIAEFFQGTNRFVLEIKGDSMMEDNILDGDLIICQQTTTPNEGDIVAALIDDCSSTLKRISFKMKGFITLIPSNPNLKPKAYAPERITIQGVYVGLVRVNRVMLPSAA